MTNKIFLELDIYIDSTREDKMNITSNNNLSFREIIFEQTNAEGTKQEYTNPANMILEKTQDGFRYKANAYRDFEPSIKDIRIIDINNGSSLTYIDNIGGERALQVDTISKNGRLAIGSNSKIDHIANIGTVNGELDTGFKTITNIKNVLSDGFLRLGKLAIANIEDNFGKIIAAGSDVIVKENQGKITEEVGFGVSSSFVEVNNNSGEVVQRHPQSIFNIKSGQPAVVAIDSKELPF